MKKLFVLATICSMFVWACTNSDTSKNADTTLTIEGTPAIADISQRIEDEPNNAELYAMRGRLFYEEEQYEAAISDLTNAVNRDSLNVAYYHLLSDAYFDANQSKSAIATLQKVVNRDSTLTNTLLKLGEMQMIVRRHEASLKTIGLIFNQDRRNPEAFYLGGLNFEQMGDTARAINSFQTTVEEDPDHIDAYRKLARHFDRQDNKIALDYFDNALRIDSTDMEALMGKGWYFHQREQFAKAKKYYEKAAKIHAMEPGVHFDNGILHLEMKDPETAYKKFDLAINVEPQYGMAYYYRALASEQTGKSLNAIINDYQQAVSLMPDPQRATAALERLGVQ